MLSITAIASSSAGNMYILDNGKSRLVLEAGIPWRRMQQALNFDLSNVAGVFVSHGHGDHSKGVKDAAKAGLDIYCSAGTAQEIGATGHRITHIRAGGLVTLGGLGWHIMPFDVVHDCQEPLGFLIVTGAHKLVFMTDSSYCKYRFKDITHMLVECNFSNSILERNVAAGIVDPSREKRLIESHFSLERLKEMLAKNDLSKLEGIWLCHLSSDNSDEVLFKREIQKLTGVPVYICGE